MYHPLSARSVALVRVLQPPGELRGTSDSSVPVLLSIYLCMYFSKVLIPVALADAMALLVLCVCSSLRVCANVCTKFAALWHASLLQKPGLGRMQMSGSKLQPRVRISAKMNHSWPLCGLLKYIFFLAGNIFLKTNSFSIIISEDTLSAE
jgi:hypothetical protein